MPVVVVQPGSKAGCSLRGAGVGGGVSPLAQGGLDEALGFAIGSGGIGFSAQMTDSQFAAGVAESMGAIGRAVVSHDSLDAHTVLEEAGYAGSEEGAGGVSKLVRHDAGQSHSRGIIDRHVHEVPADTVVDL